MLTSGADGQLAWHERKLEFFPERVSQADATYAQFPPEDEATWAAEDLSGGFGQRVAPIGASRRYYYGFADTRIPNQITLPPEVRESDTGHGGVVRAHFELGGDLFVLVGSAAYRTSDGASWALSKDFGTGVTARSAAVYKGDAAAPLAFVALGGSPADSAYWTFDGAAWTQHAGHLVDPAAVLKTTNAGAAYADYTSAASDDDGATHVDLRSLDTAAAGSWVLVGGALPFTGVRVRMNANANRSAAALAAEYWNGTAWAAVSELVDGTAYNGAALGRDGEVRFAEPASWTAATIAGTTGFWLRLSVGARLHGSTLVGGLRLREPRKADYFLTVGPELVRVSAEGGRPVVSKSVTGGPAATYTAGLPVGDGTRPATNLLALADSAYVTTADGLYRVTGSGAVRSVDRQAWPHPAASAGTDAGRGANTWRGYLWLPIRQGFYRFAPNRIEPFGPELLTGNDSPVRGRITACAGDDYFLYAAIRSEAGRSYLLALDHARASWHPLADLGARECRHMWVSDLPGPNPRLYLAVDASVASIVLPRGSANPLHDANCRYAAEGALVLSRFHGNFAAQTKAFLALSLTGENLSPRAYVSAAYRLAPDAAYQSLGRFASTGGRRIEFGGLAAGAFVDLRLTLAALDRETTPVIRAVALAYAVRTGLKRVLKMTVRVADNLPLRDGGRDRKSAADIRRAVTKAAAAEGPVSLVGPDGEVLEVLVRGVEARAQRNESGQELAWVMPVVATEYRQSAAAGSQNRLAAYRHQQLAAYTHAQAANL